MAAVLGPVPRTIHQTAPADHSRWDPRWEPCRQSLRAACPSPEHEYFLWDDPQLRELVVAAFPEHVAAYDAYKEHIQRVDFARAAMLYIYGGLYADMDVEVRRSPFQYLPPGKVSIVESPYTKNERHQNSMMASPPRHPFWRAMVEEAVRRQQQPNLYRTTWQLTGPQLLDAVVLSRPEDVHVLPHAEFNPSVQSLLFNSPDVIARHFCTSVWTHSMDTNGMRLHQAAQRGRCDDARAAVQGGADLACCDYAGLTPLHHAALKGDTDMIAVIASMRAEVSSCDKNGTTPLHYAVQVSHAAAVQTLLRCRASTSSKLRDGVFAGATPLDLARAASRESQGARGPQLAAVVALLEAAQQRCAEPQRQSRTVLQGCGRRCTQGRHFHHWAGPIKCGGWAPRRRRAAPGMRVD
mmetsp:Transcript_95006/g.245440  ORF Transcript_95006/g.245440 Transcript_95006/m.245440 type:complete len:409 (+) Transcript_95006:43-1269(+)